jgi:hypothetical protein
VAFLRAAVAEFAEGVGAPRDHLAAREQGHPVGFASTADDSFHPFEVRATRAFLDADGVGIARP